MIFHPKSKNVFSEINFVFNNNDIDAVQDQGFIYPIERIIPMKPVLILLLKYSDTIDENLTFDFHISITSKKISKALFSLKKVRHIASLNALKSVYYALIQPL